MHAHRKFRCLGSAVAVAHGSNHISFSRSTEACTASEQCLGAYFAPQRPFGAFHLFRLGVGIDFLEYEIYFLHLEVDYVIKEALRLGSNFCELVEIEAGLRCKRIFNE